MVAYTYDILQDRQPWTYIIIVEIDNKKYPLFSFFTCGRCVSMNASMMYTSSSSSPFSMISSLTLFNYLLLAFPLFLLPCIFSPISLHLILQWSFLRITCLYHFNLRSWIFCDTFSTFVVNPIASSYNISNTFQVHPVLSYTSNFSPWIHGSFGISQLFSITCVPANMAWVINLLGMCHPNCSTPTFVFFL